MSEWPKRLQTYKFTRTVAPYIFEEGNTTRVVKGCPEGAEVVDAGYNYLTQTFYLTMEHPTFDEVHEAEPIPVAPVELEEIDDE